MPWDKDRYAADPAFRKHVLEKNKAHRAVHKDEINARRRQKYATDPEFKAKLLACNSLSRRESKLKMKYGMTLAEYNAGRARVDRWIAESGKGEEVTAQDFVSNIDFPTTRRYVEDILARYHHYQRESR